MCHQEEIGGQLDQLRQSWEEERREMAVQNQLLEEELADLKGLLAQERQRSSEAHSLRETVRRMRSENKEVIMTMVIALKGAVRDFYNLLTAPRTVSYTYAQVTRVQSCTNHKQHINRLSRAACVPCGTKGQLCY